MTEKGWRASQIGSGIDRQRGGIFSKPFLIEQLYVLAAKLPA